MRRLSLALALAVACAAPAAAGDVAPARKMGDPAAAESPFIAMLRKADSAGTGSVSKADVEAPLAAVQAEQSAKIRAVWHSTALFLKVSPPDRAVPLREVVDATLSALSEADADRDGKVTKDEIEAYAAREPDPERRQAIVARLTAADVNGDGVVDAAERKVELSPEQAAEDVGERRVAGIIEGTRLWQKRSIDSLFERYAGADGRIVIDDMARRLREANEAKAQKQ